MTDQMDLNTANGIVMTERDEALLEVLRLLAKDANQNNMFSVLSGLAGQPTPAEEAIARLERVMAGVQMTGGRKPALTPEDEDQLSADPEGYAWRCTCPTCGAKPGSPCLDGTDEPRYMSHSLRFRGTPERGIAR